VTRRGLMAPGTLARASEDPAYKTALQAGGYTPASSSLEEFRAFLEQNIADWKQAARAAGITPD
jgi:tripartite-type tricarboxylate transporter receptor subunit TctC